MSTAQSWSIGELAEHAGVTVKTVRYYSDQGLLPEATRSAGGHRRYDSGSLDRLRMIRSLRTLDLPVPEVERALEREDALEDVLARQLRELGSQLSALRWREAALQLVHDSPPEERPERLRLIGSISTPPDTTAMARFWRRTLPLRLPPRLLSAILEEAVPQPPADPTPGQVLAFARLHALSTEGQARLDRCRPSAELPGGGYRPDLLYEALGEAYALAATDLGAGRAPAGGDALDCFVAAHARSLDVPDTPGFRHWLGGLLTLTVDPVVDRYWQLAGELTAPADGPNMGASHEWLRAALDAQAAATAG
ncbi:helix-turn-helix domain-containing protein [Kitasatospora sp. NPDC004240]